MIKQLLIASVLAFGIQTANAEIFNATCPDEVIQSETALWALMVADSPSQVGGLEIKCAVVNPPVSKEEFVKLPDLQPIYDSYPEVIVPAGCQGGPDCWVVRPSSDALITVRGTLVDDHTVMLVKFEYLPNGNVLYSRIQIIGPTTEVIDPPAAPDYPEQH